ncbi:hypothetical protein QQF64_023143 [Cirrhinus molitorella]|uniref:Uncharacterized protein n=1 Tax=Cirrhinus molitorella TaxID=172907 RepID=A0ABR3L7Z0_9TELE
MNHSISSVKTNISRCFTCRSAIKMIENLHRSTTTHVFDPPTGANGAMNASSETIHHCLALSHYGLISYMGMSDEKQHFGDEHLRREMVLV